MAPLCSNKQTELDHTISCIKESSCVLRKFQQLLILIFTAFKFFGQESIEAEAKSNALKEGFSSVQEKIKTVSCVCKELIIINRALINLSLFLS